MLSRKNEADKNKFLKFFTLNAMNLFNFIYRSWSFLKIRKPASTLTLAKIYPLMFNHLMIQSL